MGSQTFLDRFDVVEAWVPTLLDAGANTGDWVSLKNALSVAIICQSGIGTAGDDPSWTLLQADTNAGGNSKALNIASDRVFEKQAATSLAAVTSWTDSSANVTDNVHLDTDAAEQDQLLVIMVDPDDLDVANGFDHISVTLADVGSNDDQDGYCVYIVEKKYQTPPASNTGHL